MRIPKKVYRHEVMEFPMLAAGRTSDQGAMPAN
jgi:hypothetical protein